MLRHHWRQRFCRNVAVHALFYQTDAADFQINLVSKHFCTAVACCADDTAPVRILAEEGGFYQRRFGNGHSCGFGVLPGGSAGDINLQEFGRALAVMSNELCQIRSAGNERLEEGGIIGMLLGKNNFIFSQAVRQHNHAVIGAGVAIDNDHIKGLVSSLFHSTFQYVRRNSCICSDEGQHGRHVRMNHAGALSDTCKGHLLAVDFCFVGSTLDERIRSLNRHRAAFAFVLVEAVNGIGNACQQLVHRQELTDNTGGADKNCLRLQA